MGAVNISGYTFSTCSTYESPALRIADTHSTVTIQLTTRPRPDDLYTQKVFTTSNSDHPYLRPLVTSDSLVRYEGYVSSKSTSGYSGSTSVTSTTATSALIIASLQASVTYTASKTYNSSRTSTSGYTGKSSSSTPYYTCYSGVTGAYTKTTDLTSTYYYLYPRIRTTTLTSVLGAATASVSRFTSITTDWKLDPNLSTAATYSSGNGYRAGTSTIHITLGSNAATSNRMTSCHMNSSITINDSIVSFFKVGNTSWGCLLFNSHIFSTTDGWKLCISSIYPQIASINGSTYLPSSTVPVSFGVINSSGVGFTVATNSNYCANATFFYIYNTKYTHNISQNPVRLEMGTSTYFATLPGSTQYVMRERGIMIKILPQSEYIYINYARTNEDNILGGYDYYHYFTTGTQGVYGRTCASILSVGNSYSGLVSLTSSNYLFNSSTGFVPSTGSESKSTTTYSSSTAVANLSSTTALTRSSASGVTFTNSASGSTSLSKTYELASSYYSNTNSSAYNVSTVTTALTSVSTVNAMTSFPSGASSTAKTVKTSAYNNNFYRNTNFKYYTNTNYSASSVTNGNGSYTNGNMSSTTALTQASYYSTTSSTIGSMSSTTSIGSTIRV